MPFAISDETNAQQRRCDEEGLERGDSGGHRIASDTRGDALVMGMSQHYESHVGTTPVCTVIKADARSHIQDPKLRNGAITEHHNENILFHYRRCCEERRINNERGRQDFPGVQTHHRHTKPIGNSKTAQMIPHTPNVVVASWSPLAHWASTRREH